MLDDVVDIDDPNQVAIPAPTQNSAVNESPQDRTVDKRPVQPIAIGINQRGLVQSHGLQAPVDILEIERPPHSPAP